MIEERGPAKPSPLFESIQPELIVMEDMGGEDSNNLLDATPVQTVILIVLYLLMLVSDGEVTTVVLVAIPEILLDVTNVSFWFVAPAIIGVVGTLLSFHKISAPYKSRKTLRITNLGLTLLFISAYLFMQSSESPLLSMCGLFVFGGYYMFLYNRMSNRRLK